VGGVEIHLCDGAWWADEKTSGRSFVRARELSRMHREGKGERSPTAFRWMSDHSTGEIRTPTLTLTLALTLADGLPIGVRTLDR
jgi:hypothetical protein